MSFLSARVSAGAAPVAAAQALDPVDLEDDSLRTPQVAQAASEVAVVPEVRAALVAFQRSFATREGGAVLDGRDIGTVICPDADVKLFVTASPECRAERRFQELVGKGMDVTFDTVLADVKERDARDRNRAAAPLVPADDAVLLDTSDLTAAQAIAAAIDIVAKARG